MKIMMLALTYPKLPTLRNLPYVLWSLGMILKTMSSSRGAEALPKKDQIETVTKDSANVCIVVPPVGWII